MPVNRGILGQQNSLRRQPGFLLLRCQLPLMARRTAVPEAVGNSPCEQLGRVYPCQLRNTMAESPGSPGDKRGARGCFPVALQSWTGQDGNSASVSKVGRTRVGMC